MNKIGRMCGIDVIFGGRWDDLPGSARFKSTHGAATVYFDAKNLDLKLVPAPAVIERVVTPEDPLAVYAIFYHDEEGGIFGSVIFSGGQIAPLSEVIYETAETWIAAIQRSGRDANIDFVHIPEGIPIGGNDKHRSYTLVQQVEAKGLPRLSSASSASVILGSLVIVGILAAIGIGTWAYIAQPFQSAPEPVPMITEKHLVLNDAILDACLRDLSTPWPAPPEWTLIQEGCVPSWETAKISFEGPSDQKPYAYRLYELDSQIWDEYLSIQSFLKISKHFPGQIIQSENRFLLTLSYDRETRQVEDSYLADADPVEIVRSRFLASARIEGGDGVGGGQASTNLELDEVIARLKGEKLTPVHVYHAPLTEQTVFEFAPEMIEMREVRAP